MYKLDFSLQGKAAFKSLDKETAQRVLDKLKWLTRNIGSIAPLPLKGNLAGLYKLKVGDWRVIYEVNHIIVQRLSRSTQSDTDGKSIDKNESCIIS